MTGRRWCLICRLPAVKGRGPPRWLVPGSFAAYMRDDEKTRQRPRLLKASVFVEPGEVWQEGSLTLDLSLLLRLRDEGWVPYC